jgi:hypothetical protein
MSKIKFMHQVVLTAVIAALLLFVANTAIWANRAIFDTSTFTNTAVSSLTSDSSRQALAQEVVDRALADRPIVKNIAGNTATKLVGGLLGTSQFNAVLEKAVGKLQVYLTSNEQKSISVDLSGVKGTVEKLVGVANDKGANTDNVEDRLSTIPDEIVLVNADNIPSFYTYGLIFLWLGPISALLALGLLVYPYLRDRTKYYKIAIIQGVALVVAGLVSLLVGPLVRPPALANITSPNMRIVVGNLYDSFISIFNQQAYWLIAAGILLACVPSAVRYGLRLANKRSAKLALKNSKVAPKKK